MPEPDADHIKRKLPFLQHPECSTFSNGEYLKSGLDELEKWCNEAKEEFAGSSWDELKHTRQAVGFLALSVQQFYKVCTVYSQDNNNEGVSADVLSQMKLLMTDVSEDDGSSLLLMKILGASHEGHCLVRPVTTPTMKEHRKYASCD
ncbi:hypothetical protein V6N12_076299 [Hibiscus sabdariffa]|uniref:Dilute domain-containing protein n=1 Tax=Hibiscus sabdariffa TaxID=183260 RepID=A0ABR2A3B3_9ROSI